MPIIRRTDGNSREARLEAAVLSRDGKGGPFGKHDQRALEAARPAVRKLITDIQAARILGQ